VTRWYAGDERPGPCLAVRALARAKVTLSLRVLGHRPDGYHALEALAVSVAEPSDAVDLRLRPGVGVRLQLSGRAAGVPAGPQNLCARAARLLLEEAAASQGPWAATGLEIALHKSIPAGAGLGGGSADAAATLLAGTRLLGLGIEGAALAALAAHLGSDVPFCLAGGAAWMRGRGEVLEPLALPGPTPLVVAVPPFALATPAVYAAWDRLGGPRAERTCPPPPSLAPLLPDGLANDLEPAAEAVEPRLRPFREALEFLAGRPAVMAGSGSAYAVPADSEAEAAALVVAATRLGTVAFATQPAPRGVDLEDAGP
jgi:4-diphosphocytidyl-2-C-methyl-D-erythritol kinase